MMVCFETGRAILWDERGATASQVYAAYPCIRCRDHFLVQPGYVMAPLVPSRRKARKGKDQRWKKSEIVAAEVEALLVRGHDRHCAN